jgi:riboflavin kinase/FMN adenylyltransferase
MKILRRLEDLDEACRGGSAVTIGVFDAMHSGHVRLMEMTLERARAMGIASLVFTFRDHPLAVLAPAHCPNRITQPEEKARLIEAVGVDLCLMLEFTPTIAAIEAETFIREVLAGRCAARFVACGENFTFGAGGKGDAELLRRRGAEFGFEVSVLPAVIEGASAASSSRVRALIIDGRVAEAAELLHRPYGFAARAIEGDGRGRKLGFPTANLQPPRDQLIPADGVYAVMARLESRAVGGMMNVGARPTFEGAGRAIEVHLFDFAGDLTGAEMRIDFLDRVREERRFGSAEALIEQLKRDEATCRALLRQSAT